MELQKLIDNIPVISDNTQYWFIRTEGGLLYEAFLQHGTIAIGYTEVKADVIRSAKDPWYIKKLITDSKYDIKHPGLAASQLFNFCRTIRKGDIVLIPRYGSHEIAIGLVEDNEIYEEVLTYKDKEGKNGVHNGFEKRRKVRWIREFSRSNSNPNMWGMFSARQAIQRVNSYSKWINPLMYDVFTKGGRTHVYFRVKKKGDIKAVPLVNFYAALFDLAEDFSEDYNITGDVSDVKTRVSISSPGAIELIYGITAAAVLVSVLSVAINGGGFELHIAKWDIHLNLKTDGLIKNIAKFKRSAKRDKTLETLREKIKELEVLTPNDIVKIYKEVDKDDNEDIE